jgi:hypothetical protein
MTLTSTPNQVQLDTGRLISAPSDELDIIRAAKPDAPSPYRELKNPEWIAWVEAMPDYKNLVGAATDGDLETVHRLLAAGADPSLRDLSDGGIFGMTPLFAAASIGELSIVRMLLAHGAAVNDQPLTSGKAVCGTALHAACGCDHARGRQADCAEVLVRAGCDTQIEDGYGKTAADYARSMKQKRVLKRLQALERKPFMSAPARGG